MNPSPPRGPAATPDGAPDDLSIPILTERLGLPPLEFDTTLPLIETTGQVMEPSLEGLTALPMPPPAGGAGLHPIAALPFPPMPSAADPAIAPAPAAAAPAPVALATLPKPSSGGTYGGFVPVVGAPAVASPAAAPRPTAPAAARASAPAPPPATAPAPSPRPAPASAWPPTAAAITAPPFALEASPPGAEERPFVERRANGTGPHWSRIEVELRSSILRQITGQLPREIEGIVQGRMQPAIERLLTSLAEEIHLAVTASLGDIVERAVRAELDRMRNSNRG
jgi:hypothetical protein